MPRSKLTGWSSFACEWRKTKRTRSERRTRPKPIVNVRKISLEKTYARKKSKKKQPLKYQANFVLS